MVETPKLMVETPTVETQFKFPPWECFALIFLIYSHLSNKRGVLQIIFENLAPPLPHLLI